MSTRKKAASPGSSIPPKTAGKSNADSSGPTNIVEAPEPLYKENPELEKGDIKQVDWEADGADVTVKRTVTRNGEPYLTGRIHHPLPTLAGCV